MLQTSSQHVCAVNVCRLMGAIVRISPGRPPYPTMTTDNKAASMAQHNGASFTEEKLRQQVRTSHSMFIPFKCCEGRASAIPVRPFPAVFLFSPLRCASFCFAPLILSSIQPTRGASTKQQLLSVILFAHLSAMKWTITKRYQEV